MPEQSDMDYFLKRAAEERARAERATDNAASIRHFELAEQYDDRAKGRLRVGTIPQRG